MSKQFYILSLSHSPVNGMAVWWRGANSGFTTSLILAGVYPEESVTAQRGYYDNGSETRAIEKEAVDNYAYRVVDFGVVRDCKPQSEPSYNDSIQ